MNEESPRERSADSLSSSSHTTKALNAAGSVHSGFWWCMCGGEVAIHKRRRSISLVLFTFKHKCFLISFDNMDGCASGWIPKHI